jgi:hypothetical protein
VNPAGNGSTKEIAEVFQGMTRHIEVQSDAEVAYDIAFDYLGRTGKGFWRAIDTLRRTTTAKPMIRKYTLSR